MSNKREISRVLYELKKEFPAFVELVNTGPTSIDWTTGIESLSEQATKIKAILVPDVFNFKFTLPSTLGTLEIGEKVLIFSTPNVPLTTATVVRMDGKRWDIKTISDLNGAGFVVTIKEVNGSIGE